MLKDRKPILFIVSGAAIALAGGAFLGYWLSGQQSLMPPLPAGAEVVPQNALITVTLSTDPLQWRRLRSLGTPQSRRVLDTTLVDWRDRFLTQNGYNFTRDIQPWVGNEVTVALLAAPTPATEVPDSAVPAPTAEAQPMIAVLPIARPEVAQQTLDQPKRGTDQQVRERTYQGMNLWEVDGEGDRDYAATVLDGKYLVLATTPQAAEATIDTYRGQPSLKAVTDYRDAFNATAIPDSFLRLYINAPQAKTILTANNLQPIPVLPLTPLQNNQGMVATVAVTDDGLRIRGANWLPANSPIRYSVNNTANRIPSLLPDNTLMMASGSNLQEFWQRYSQTATAPPDNPLNPNTFQSGIRSLTGLDLSQDLLPWMTGDFSLSLVPLPSPTASLQTGLLLTVQTSDRTAADRTLQRLDEVMRSRYQYQVAAAQVEGKPVVNWVSPFGSLTFSHGWLDDRTAFLALGPSLASAVLPQPNSALSQAPPLLALTGTPPSPASGQFFVNVEALLSANQPFPLPQFPPDADALVRALSTVSLTTVIRDGRSTGFDLYVQTKREGMAEPLPK